MKQKKILITGASGSIGSELVRQLNEKNKLFILDINESGFFDLLNEQKAKGHWIHGRVGDIRNQDTLEDVFSDFKPDEVYHAAALKHVTPNELYPEEAIKTNVLGTYNLIKFAKRYEVKKFVFISTDKAVNATCIMGATKRIGEIMVKNQGYTAVRFGNVLGSRGSVIPIWQEQVNKGKKITITHPDMKRYFMTIEEAVNLVIKAGEMSKGGEIFILDMGEQINVLDIAKGIVAKLRNKDIEEIGIRVGEEMEEKLMTKEEEKKAIKKDNFYII